MLAKPLPVGTVIACRFEVQGLLGRGGFGVVYKVADLEKGGFCALKELCPPGVVRREDGSLDLDALGPEASTLRRLIRSEAEVLTRRRFPHVLSVRALIADLGTLYFATDYLPGARSLDRWIKDDGGLGESGALDVLLPIAEALSAIHAVGLLHLDVKPSNILVDPKGASFLIDFGSARAWPRLSGMAGSEDPFWVTEGFAAPEVLHPDTRGSLSPATDLFGLSATLYYAITGAPPPDAGHPLPLPLGASPAVREALRLGLQPDPRHRPESVEEWLDLLRADPRDFRADWRALDQKAEALRKLGPVGKGCPRCGEPMERPRPKPKWTCPACSSGRLHRLDFNPRRCPGCPTGVLHAVRNDGPLAVCPVCAEGQLLAIRRFPMGPVRAWRCQGCQAELLRGEGNTVSHQSESLTWEAWRERSGRGSVIWRCDQCGLDLDELSDGSRRARQPVQGHRVLLPDEWARVALGRSPGAGEVECDGCGAEFALSEEWMTLIRLGPTTPKEAVRLRARPLSLEAIGWHAAGKTSGQSGPLCPRCHLEFDDDGDSLILVRSRDALLRQHIGLPATPDEWARLSRGLPLPEHEPDFWRDLDNELRRAYASGELPLYEGRDGNVLWDGRAVVDREGKQRQVTFKVGEDAMSWGTLLKTERRSLADLRKVDVDEGWLCFSFVDDEVEIRPDPLWWEVELKSGRRTVELGAHDLAAALKGKLA